MKTEEQIAIDARMYNHSGIGTYLRNLIGQYAKLDIKDEVLLITPPNIPNFGFRTRTSASRIYGLGEQTIVPITARTAKVFHSPHYNAPLLFPGKLVVTIHDLIHLEYEKLLPSLFHRLYARLMLNAAVSKADRIITVSNWTGEDVARRWPKAKKKINVIHNGVMPSPCTIGPDGVREKYGVDKPYILYVGLLKRHKNVKRLVEAFAAEQKKLKGEYLLVIGGNLSSDDDGLRELVNCSEEKHLIRLIGYVSEADLSALYDKASLFAFPSLIEGFGLPPLEAMSYAVPVISSNATCLPEILGDAPIYFNPRDIADIARALDRGLHDEEWREKAKTSGPATSAQYNWGLCARKHIEIYKSLL